MYLVAALYQLSSDEFCPADHSDPAQSRHMMITPIPQPPALPLLGNIRDVDVKTPTASLLALHQKYGGLYQLALPRQLYVFAGSHAVVQELSNQRRFSKIVSGALEHAKMLAGNGLVTAGHGDHIW